MPCKNRAAALVAAMHWRTYVGASRRASACGWATLGAGRSYFRCPGILIETVRGVRIAQRRMQIRMFSGRARPISLLDLIRYRARPWHRRNAEKLPPVLDFGGSPGCR